MRVSVHLQTIAKNAGGPNDTDSTNYACRPHIRYYPHKERIQTQLHYTRGFKPISKNINTSFA